MLERLDECSKEDRYFLGFPCDYILTTPKKRKRWRWGPQKVQIAKSKKGDVKRRDSGATYYSLSTACVTTLDIKNKISIKVLERKYL